MPERFIGGEYYLIELDIQKRGRLTFLLDTGLTSAVMLTAASCERLGVSYSGGGSEGLGATGNVWMPAVNVIGAQIASDDGWPWPLRPMAGVVVDDFPQRKIGQEVGVQIDGMLGQGFLAGGELELNPVDEALRVWPPGLLPRRTSDWAPLSSLRLPGDLQGLLLSVPGATEPVMGIVDTGASHTVVNARAAESLRLARSEQPPGQEDRKTWGTGLDGTRLEMPLVVAWNASLCGASEVTITPTPVGAGPKSWTFRNTYCPPAEQFGPFGAAEVGVGDIAFFEELLSQGEDSIGRFDGAVALLGQDLLAQFPLRISASTGRIWLQRRTRW